MSALTTKIVEVAYPDFGKLLTYSEGVKSATAIRKGIKNVPTAQQYANMVRVYKELYVPICAKWGKLPVSSFFRSTALNKAIGGATSSAHLSGLAIDIDCDGIGHPTNRELYAWVKKNLQFDQLIGESPTDEGNYSWVHIGLSATHNRQQCLIMVRQDGKTVYVSD